MISVAKLAVELNIGRDEILYFLNQNGYEKPHLNSRITDELENEFRQNFKKEKTNINKPLEGFENNLFDKEQQIVEYKGKANIHSHFSDSEASIICSKMSDGIIRYYAKEYSVETKEKHKLFLKYQLHYLAMKALNFYGGQILTFIFKLKIFPGKRKNAKLLTASKKRFYEVDPTLPELEFFPVGENEKCYIRFSREIDRKRAYYSFIVYNKHRRPLYSVSDKGELITNYENRFPKISIFTEFINGEKKMYSGYDNIYCDICGRELTDELSVLYGRGPTCRDNHPL